LAAVSALLVLAFGAGSVAASPPAAPTDLAWENFQFSWRDNSDDETGFKLLISIGGSPWEMRLALPADSTAAPTPEFTFDEWCRGIWAQVVAFNEAGDSAPSNTVGLPPPPSHCRDTFQQTFINDTPGWAYGLAFEQHYGVQAVRLVQNAAGCPEPEVGTGGVFWPEPCAGPGASLTLEFDVESPSLIDAVWEAVVPPFGDAQCDGDTDAVDALVVLRHVAALQSLSPCGQAAGDTNGDAVIDAVDAWRILRAAAGLPAVG